MNSAVTDEQLMASYCESGDKLAFEQIFARYAGRFRSLFRRGGCSDTIAADLVQQTFLHIHRARHDFTQGRPLRPWIYTIASNVRREHFRRLRRKPETQLDLERHPEPRTLPDTSSVRDRLVRRALDDLSASQREVIVLHWFEGLSFREIGEVVGASTSAVKVRAHRGYEKLRVALKPPADAEGSSPPDTHQ